MAPRSRSTSRKSKSVAGGGLSFPARLGVWAGIVVAVIGVLYLAQRGIHHVFFSGNPHFVVKNVQVEIEKGAISEQRILDRIAATQGADNLFSLQLADLRADLLSDPIIQEAEVRRQLPGTLRVTIYGRTPVAQLQRNGGPLIDAEGIVLPASDLRETLTLPVITGLPGLADYAPGNPTDNDSVRAALHLLRLRDTIADGHWYDVDFIQLDQNAGELRLLLRAKPQLQIRDGCLVTVPVENMRQALERGIAVIRQRAGAHQPTGSLNLTFDKVPATP